MKALRFILLFFFFVMLNLLYSQSNLTLFAEKDALIRYFNISGDTVNRGDYEYINMHAWTNSGIYVVHRSLIDFDLESLSADSLIKATLKLYSDRNSSIYPEGHQILQYFPENDIIVQRIVEDWDEYTVHWNNRPDITFKNEIYVPSSGYSFQDYEIDVTEMVRDMLLHPDQSQGFMLRLRIECYFTRMVFASSDNATEEYHPRLEIQFDPHFGLKEPGNEQKFRIAPNPFNIFTTFSYILTETSLVRINIFNSRGQHIKKIDQVQYEGEQESQWNAEELPAGMYYLRIEAGDKIGSGKMIKIK